MARRGKHSTALFEVIKAGKRELKPLAPSPRTRRGWLFGRANRPAVSPTAIVPVAQDPDDPTANVTPAMLMASRPAVPIEAPPSLPEPVESIAAIEPVAIEPEPAPVLAIAPVAAPAPAMLAAAPVVVAEAVALPAPVSAPAPLEISTATTPILTRSGMRLAVDRQRQEVTLRMRYTSAVVTAFTVLVTIGLAYVIGRRMSEGPVPAKASDLASSTQPKPAVQPSVLNPNKPAKPAARKTDSSAPTSTAGKQALVPPRLPAARPAESPLFVDAKVSNGIAQRTVGLNYLVITSYPAEKKATAIEIANFLIVNGIACTVEPAPPKTQMPAGWCYVIGTRGFPPRYGENAKYKEYLKDISAAEKKYQADPTHSKSKFDRVQPMTFKLSE